MADYYKELMGTLFGGGGSEQNQSIDVPQVLQSVLPPAVQNIVKAVAPAVQSVMTPAQHKQIQSEMTGEELDAMNYPNAPKSAPYQAPETPWYEDAYNSVKKGFSSVGDAITGNPELAQAGLGLATTLYGKSKADKYYDQSRQTLQDAANLAGTYVPLQQSAQALIQDDPALQAMQMQALQKIQGLANTGTTPEDEAFRRQQQDMVNAQFQAREAQAADERQRRGVQAGSGLAMAQSLASNQQATQQASQAADADMIRKQAAKTAAIGNLANTAGSMQQSQFDRNLNRAAATDKFNMANVTNQMNAAQNKANALSPIAASQTQQGKGENEMYGAIGNTATTYLNKFKKKEV